MPAKYTHYTAATARAEDLIEFEDSAAEYLESLNGVPRELGWLYAAHICQDEVASAGFEQFFFGHAGVLAPEAVEGFQAIGQPAAARLLKDAMEKFGPAYSRERLDRVAVLDDMDADTAIALEELETTFTKQVRKEAGGFKKAADRYAAALAGQVQ